MAFVIALPCIGVKDAACVAVCPCDVIHPLPGTDAYEREEQLYIDPEGCILCGLCVDECPAGAIFDEADLPTEWQSFVEKNAAYFRDRPA